MKTIIVDNKNNNKKLNNIILESFPNLNINTLYKALRKKDIRVNGKRVSENICVNTGDEISVFISDEILFNKKNILNNSSIIYEDDNIVVINKPSEIEVTGDNSLTDTVSSFFGTEVFPCHRLDRNTSGLVLFAKNIMARDILFGKFKNHEIEKHYACVVYGIPKKNSEILTAYLFKDSKQSIVYIKDAPQKGYQKIITEYKVLQLNKETNTSVLDVTLHTGRTHQIRAHLAHIGYPILGDGKYGLNEINKKFKLKHQQLCSYSLEFKFTTDAGILNYLNEKFFSISIPFAMFNDKSNLALTN